jgi:hypothetical protein
MRPFLFGIAVGATAMYFRLEGFAPIVMIIQGWWWRVSSPHAMALQ